MAIELHSPALALNFLVTRSRYEWHPSNFRLRNDKDVSMAQFKRNASRLTSANLPWVFRLLSDATEGFDLCHADADKNVGACLPHWFKSWYYEAKNYENRLSCIRCEWREARRMHKEPDWLLASEDFMRWAMNRSGDLSNITGLSAFHMYLVADSLGIPTTDAAALRANFQLIADHYPRVDELRMVLAHHDKMFRMLNTLSSAHMEAENPSIVKWYEIDLFRESFVDVKPKTAKLAKFLRRLNTEFEFTIPDSVIEHAATWVGEKLRVPTYDIELLDSGFLRTYREASFNSCMHHSDAPKFYAKQNKHDTGTKVQMMTLRCPEGSLIGRALVWHGVKAPDGRTVSVLDRVYPSDNGYHIRAAMAFAKSKGWVYKTEHSIDGALSEYGEFTLTAHDVGYYPYMDTFAYTDGPDKDGNFTLSNCRKSNYYYELRSTANSSPWEPTQSCVCCGGRYEEERMNFSNFDSDWVCENCLHGGSYVYSDAEDDFIPSTMVVYPLNCPDYPVSRDNSMLTFSRAVMQHIYEGYIPRNVESFDCVEVSHGQFAGELVLARDCYEFFPEESPDEPEIYANLHTFQNRAHFAALTERLDQVYHPTQPQGQMF
jgi:hypothetical protein